MRYFLRSKRFLIIGLIIITVISFLIFTYLRTANVYEVKFDVDDNNPSIKASYNYKFDSKKLDSKTLELFKANNIKNIKIVFTNIQTTFSTIGVDDKGTSMPSEGYDIKLEGETFTSTLFINKDAFGKTIKSNDQLMVETLQQMFLSFNQLDLDIKTNWQPSQAQAQETLNQRYADASEEAQNLLKDKNNPFVITFNN